MNLSLREKALCLGISLATFASRSYAVLPIDFEDTGVAAADVAAVLVAAITAIVVPIFAWKMIKKAIGR